MELGKKNFKIINMSRKVNFIGIGAQKAGTSWLAEALNEHPEIYIHKKKEAHYFNRRRFFINTFHYERSFRPKKQEKIIGEITPSYISDKKVAKRIYNYNPSIKIIAILRDPTDRCVSQYRMEMKRGTIEKNENIWDAFINDLPKYGPMRERGYYKQQLDRYYKLFNKEQILILDCNELRDSPDDFIKKAYNFLDVDKRFIPNCLTKRIRHKKDLPGEIKIDKKDIEKIRKHYQESNL